MNRTFGSEPYERSSVLANGIADLMTSLAVIFILLLAAYIVRGSDGTATIVQSRSTPETKRPGVLTVIIPDTALNFDFGKSALLPSSTAFLSENIPHYVSMICGPEGQDVEAFIIEGYTDDLGDDVHNLRLSQERSFAVLAKSLEIVHKRIPWAYECFLQKATANGRGRQNLLRNATGYPDRNQSRRVVFKIHRRPM